MRKFSPEPFAHDSSPLNSSIFKIKASVFCWFEFPSQGKEGSIPYPKSTSPGAMGVGMLALKIDACRNL